MFRHIRIMLLLYILLFVALGSWLTRHSSTDWDTTLWVTVYPINGDASESTEDYIATLGQRDFKQVTEFFARETTRFGRAAAEPVRINIGPRIDAVPPQAPAGGNLLQVARWSLHFRYWAWRQTRGDTLPTPDVRLFMVFHRPGENVALEPSLGLSKGLIGIVNAFASREMAGSNQLILAHELLHTLGASDKYDPVSNLPVFPAGYADPQKTPLYPQNRAEIMGGRRVVSPSEAVIPRSLKNVIIGPVTAIEVRLAES